MQTPGMTWFSMSKTKMSVQHALETSTQLPAQTIVKLPSGQSIRRTKTGIAVVRSHYSCHPERNPETHPEWKKAERRTYTSQASWDREQEIIDNAGGGELVFADVLVTYWNKIVITNPEWHPDPRWRIEVGFDHGKTNPTAFLRCYIDHEGNIYFCGEYYQPGREIWEHAPRIKQMADIHKISAAYADPTIFDATMQQSNQPTQTGKAAERAKSINDLYIEQGIEIFAPFQGDRSDISFAAQLLSHWSNLESCEPRLKIVCRNYSERPQLGLHNWDCPNLLWELMRTRRVKLSAQQLLSRNPAEAIVDKDNHAQDAMKYVLMSHPKPAVKSFRERAQEITQPLADAGDLTSAYIRYLQFQAEEKAGSDEPFYMGHGYRRRYQWWRK
jgi:hypothetical protein